MTPCRRCLLEAMDDRKLYDSVKAMVEALPESIRADDALYRQRLAVCQACDHLLSGMCIKCGCYVELRCAKAPLACPDIPSRW